MEGKRQFSHLGELEPEMHKKLKDLAGLAATSVLRCISGTGTCMHTRIEHLLNNDYYDPRGLNPRLRRDICKRLGFDQVRITS